jgi:hypothetical protein
MVTRITTPHSIQRALNYNEQKVRKGQAEFLFAGNYLKDAAQLNFYDKLKRFTDLISLNERAKTNSLHISINFDNSDMLSKEKITEIAIEYMDKIGFGNQPYLVYQHIDAGHPHLHIVTTNIKADGKRIDTFNIGRNQSEKARRELEQKFNLVQAKGRKISKEEIRPVSKIVQYGKSETKRTITNVLDHVLNRYKYSSLAELNAVLKFYNLVADRGTENSRIYKNQGLVYRILDEKGNKIGVPIKASLIHNSPGLKFLEEKFAENNIAKQQYKRHMQQQINGLFTLQKNIPLSDFISRLKRDQIHVTLRQNKEGFIYGITYVDLKKGCVFNGSDLGKEYSAKGILQRCEIYRGDLTKQQPYLHVDSKSEATNNLTLNSNIGAIIDDLIKPEFSQQIDNREVNRFKKRKGLRMRI